VCRVTSESGPRTAFRASFARNPEGAAAITEPGFTVRTSEPLESTWTKRVTNSPMVVLRSL